MGAPLVEVTWHDSFTSRATAWQDTDGVNAFHGNPAVCHTVGYLVKRDRTGVTLAMSKTDGGQYGSLWHVPAAMVRRLHRLRSAR